MPGTGPDKALENLRAICLALPETTETLTWGHPNFRVDNKIFCSFGGEHLGLSAISLKVGLEHQPLFLADPRFFKTPYVGNKGWVSLKVEGRMNWTEVRELVCASYRLIAPKRLGKLLPP